MVIRIHEQHGNFFLRLRACPQARRDPQESKTVLLLLLLLRSEELLCPLHATRRCSQ